MQISDHRKIVEIQEEFNSLFPYLRLQFFARSNKANGPSSDKLVRHTKTMGECRTIHKEGNVTISPFMKVSELEDVFRDVYGLEVQVLRRSGKAWLASTLTDAWTLEEQNNLGESLTKFVP
jgi:hypothetical protein